VDEDASGHLGHSRQSCPPRLTRLWQGYLHLPMIARIKASLHHVVESKLKDIHVIREFSDVFLDNLPGMPPERAIEFKIELQPGTSPIAKAPYKMSSIELA
jgi:hypothetical protein